MFGFDIDTIKVHIGWRDLDNYDFKFLHNLVNEIITVKSGYYTNWFEGKYKGFKITFFEGKGITISGSFSNYYVGFNNILSPYLLKKAVDKLGLELNLNLHNSELRRCDLAYNEKPYLPVKQYTHHLFTYMTRFDRLEQVDGVRFENKTKTFAIYNKTLQLLEKKGIEIDDCLRFELRLLRNVSQVFGIKKMKLSDLYKPEVYSTLLSLFYKYYSNIQKQTISIDRESEFITPKIFNEILMKFGIEGYGGDKVAYRLIDQLDKEGRFKNAIDKSRCRNTIKKLSSNTNQSTIHPLAQELNLKIEEAFNNEILKIEKWMKTTNLSTQEKIYQ